MPRATTKAELSSAADDNFEKLFAFIDSIPEHRRKDDFKLNGRDNNIRDVLCHLHEWHNMLKCWHNEGLKGGMPAVPGEGYTWKTLPALNREIWKKYQGTGFAEAVRLLRKSHAVMVKLIERHDNAELFANGVFAWTKSSTLGAYFVSATASHYDWALKTLKAIKKQLDS